jgi:hypothetical protein
MPTTLSKGDVCFVIKLDDMFEMYREIASVTLHL